jgi:hypothetical protein
VAHSVKRTRFTRPRRSLPKLTMRQVLGAIWLWDTVKGITPPPMINQGLVAALGLLGAGSIKAQP